MFLSSSGTQYALDDARVSGGMGLVLLLLLLEVWVVYRHYLKTSGSR